MSNYIEPRPAKYSLSDLYAKWDQLADVSVGEDGSIDAPFLHFGNGTPREEIWRWFENQNSRFSVGEVQRGIRHPDESLSSQLNFLSQKDALRALGYEVRPALKNSSVFRWWKNAENDLARPLLLDASSETFATEEDAWLAGASTSGGREWTIGERLLLSIREMHCREA